MEYDSNYSLTREIGNKLGITNKNYDSTYSILKEILPLVEDAASTIKTVDVLPDVQTKYNNLYRLTTDDNVYMAKAESTFQTNTLPDKQQIGKAYLFEDYDSVYYYDGFWTVKLIDGTLTGYGWLQRRADDSFSLVVTEDNAVISSKVTDAHEHAFGTSDGDYSFISVDFENHIVTMNENVHIWNWSANGGFDNLNTYGTLIPATYNAPESIQIGNAYIVDENSTTPHTYTGEEIIITVDGKETVVYKWQDTELLNNYIATDKKASEIYYTGDYPNLVTDVKIYDLSTSPIQQTTIYEMYIPQLNAPESAQIGTAYINTHGSERTYQGEYTVQCSDGNVTVYLWSDDIEYPESCFITRTPASEIYSQTIEFSYLYDFPNWVSREPYIFSGTTAEFNELYDENIYEVEQGDFELVKQTRTEIQYGWKKLITEDDI